MKDWNVVVTIYQQGFRRALHALRQVGAAERSPHHNVLVMKVADAAVALTAIEHRTELNPALYDAIARVAPAMRAFDFRNAEDFKDKAKSAVLEWTPALAGRSFHVRLHRRGPALDMHSLDVERFLNDAIVAATAKIGNPARISFRDPDAVVVIDTVDDRAGVAIWTRADLQSHRLLRPD